MALPVFDTREVLLDHLFAKLAPLCSTKLVAKKILLEVSNNLHNKDILELLQNDKIISETVKKFEDDFPVLNLPVMGGPGMNFMQRPSQGWLHEDDVIRTTGVMYHARYMGCIEVFESMKKLDYDTRFLLAKECINKVCQVSGLQPSNVRKKAEKRIRNALGSKVKMDHAGSNVKLNISAKSISIRTVEGNYQVSLHDMPKISFASGGDAETPNFISYVAKDDRDFRACYVLECGSGKSQDIICTIGQAFSLRFNDCIANPELAGVSLKINPSSQEADREYYNDLPGKIPPDVGQIHPNISATLPMRAKNTYKLAATRERLPSTNSNLIDLNSELPPPSLHTHDYVNDVVFNPRPAPRDVFDMQPFHDTLSSDIAQLQNEEWFHGVIGRAEAESLLKRDGDFLVRESSTSPGQYILTGLQGTTKKHLLLIDPDGIVRTKDHMFESISHLINFHWDNKLPIISAESALFLRNPICRLR